MNRITAVVDGFEWHSNHTGVGRYLFGLLPRMAALSPQVTWHVGVPAPLTATGEPLPGNLVLHDITDGPQGYSSWLMGPMRRFVHEMKPDLFFSPNHALPPGLSMPAYLCIHDLSWRDLPGEFPWRNRMMRHMSTRKALKKAAGVVCVSRFTQERLLHHYEVDPRKVRVIPSGLSPQWKRAGRQEIKDFRSRLKLDDQMVVGYLGTLLPRRHIREMLESFALLNRRFPAWLVVVGENRIGPEIEPMLHQPGVIWLPRLEEKDLTAFYSSLDLFLYLSEYEGFGFPPLEALACGTPALVLEGSSLSEFTGDFAATTPCFHPQALAEQITGLLTTERSRATQGIDRFRNQRQQFSWERSAQSHLELMGLLGSAGKG